MRLTIVRGLPGAGKSTWAKENMSCLIVEQDMYFQRAGQYQWSGAEMKNAVAWCKKIVTECLRTMDVCVVNTFTTKAYVDEYVRIAHSIGAEVIIIKVIGNFESVHHVPRNVLDSMTSKWEDYPGEEVIDKCEDVELPW